MSTTKYTPKKKRKPIFEQKKGDLDNLNNPMIFLVSHNFQPGMQMHVCAFEDEEDAASAEDQDNDEAERSRKNRTKKNAKTSSLQNHVS